MRGRSRQEAHHKLSPTARDAGRSSTTKVPAIRRIPEHLGFAAAVVGALYVALDPFGVLDHVPWLVDRIPRLTLFVVSSLAAYVYWRLWRLRASISRLGELVGRDFRYLPERRDVDSELVEITRSAKWICAIGGRSTNERYLDLISDLVRDGTSYRRLLTGEWITDAMHEHLRPLLETKPPNVKVRWTRKEKHGYWTITDAHAVLVMPSPKPAEYSALVTSEPSIVDDRRTDFQEAFSEDTGDATLELLEYMCRDCDPDKVRNVYEMEEMVLRRGQRRSDAV